jgi:hypothetical protein
MIARTVKLYPTAAQAARMDEWFQIGTGVWNWALSQYLPGPVPDGPQMQGRWPTHFSLNRATAGHGVRIGFNARALDGILRDVSRAWADFRSGLRGKPHRKGVRNRLASIPFRQKIKVDRRSVYVPSLGLGEGARPTRCVRHRYPL